MQDLFELTPELLLEQSQEMTSLCGDFENLFAGISSDLKGANDSWSDLLAHNFSGKINSAQKAFMGALTMMRNSAGSIRNVAQAAQEMDDEWASKIGTELCEIMSSNGASANPEAAKPAAVDMDDYCSRVSDAEYGKLCGIMNQMDSKYREDGAAKMEKEFLKKLKKDLPANDPLRNVTADQVEITTSSSGFTAAVIKSGDDALVIFAGTNFTFDAGDYVADAGILAGIDTKQVSEAKKLVKKLSKECDNIRVTGHSLGGYLATAATLDNDAVSECVAFDPPGRKDWLVQNIANHDQVKKVRTYEAVGSPVSSNALGHMAIGKWIPVVVPMKDNIANHLIAPMVEALEEKNGKIKNTWN